MDTKTDGAGDQKNPPRQTVLIIDDDRGYIGVVVEFLKLDGLTTLAAHSGEDGLVAARHHRPDLILLDVQMPGIDGYETCRRLKADVATGEIPVLFMSGQADIEDKMQGFLAGGLDYIPKPFQSRELLARVRTQLKLQDQARHLQEQTLEMSRAHDQMEQEVVRRVRAEEVLQKARDELEQRVEERTAALKKSQSELTAKIQELSALNAIAHVIANTSDLDEMLQRVLEATLSLAFLEVQKKGVIFLRDEKDPTRLNRVAYIGIKQFLVDTEEQIDIGHCLCGTCAGNGRTMITTGSCIAEHTVQYQGMPDHGHAVLPIKSRENVLGVMTMYLEPGVYPGESEVRLLEAIVSQIGLAVENRRLFRDIETSKKEWEETFDSIADLVTINALDNTVLRLNSAAARVFGGYQSSIGRKFYELLGDKRFAECRKAVTDSSAIPGTATIQGRQYDMSVYPIEEQGVPRGCVFVAKDVTERNQAAEALARYSGELTALNAASNTLMVTANLQEIYQKVCDIIISVFDVRMCWLGLVETGTFAVRPVAHAGHEDGYLSTIHVTWDDSPLGQGPGGMAIKTRTTRQSTIDDPLFSPWSAEARKRGYLAILAVPLISAGDRCIGVLIFHNSQAGYFTADRVKLCQIFANQAAIAIENARLIEGLEATVLERTQEIHGVNRELLSLNQELELRRQEAEAANRTKSDFLANMSHELRTPLNAIIGFSDLMARGMAGPLAGDQKEYVGDILTSGQHLLSLINDILDLSKVEAGKMEFEPAEVDLADLVGSSLSMFREKALKHGIQLGAQAAAGAVRVYGDERKIKQVVFNLLSNALKFTPDGGSVSVRTAVVKADGGDYVEIAVSDTGIGMTLAEQQQLFQPFKQLGHPLTKSYEGTGLGLALCKKFVELHKGSITVESAPGQGSTFTVRLPLGAEGKRFT